MAYVVKIEKEVPVTIFNEPILSGRIESLFIEAKEIAKARMTEIMKYIKERRSIADELDVEKIFFYFKMYFYKQILNEAVELTFSEEGRFDVLENILSLLTFEKLKAAICGEPMIDAFSKAIRDETGKGSAFDFGLRGGLIFLLEKEFLGKEVPWAIKKSKKRNFCGECGCSCECNAGCGGDVKKCTSKVALEKKCTHHCLCYIGPASEHLESHVIKCGKSK